jgi:hypothetical protein
MPAAYGTVGAVFTAAIDGFESGLTRTGSALACDYRRMSEALNIASASYQGVDQASEVAVARSAASIDAGGLEWDRYPRGWIDSRMIMRSADDVGCYGHERR